MVTHGAVADFALVAEGTGFGIVGVEPGKAHFKVTVFTDTPRYYTPYLPRPTGLADAPERDRPRDRRHRRVRGVGVRLPAAAHLRGPNGTIVPKASINAIRSAIRTT